MRRGRAGTTSCLLLVMLFLAPRDASGHGRFPESNEIVFSPSDPNKVVARTTFALLPSSDEGATWSYLCLESLGLTSFTPVDPVLAFTANGTLLAGLVSPVGGLNLSSDLGCAWGCAGGPLAGQMVVDTVVRPDAPHHVVVLASTYAEGGVSTQAFESGDDGVSWSPLGPALDPTVVVTGIDVSATDAARLYVSGTRGYGASRTASLFTWTQGDAAAGWAEHSIPQFSGNIMGYETSIYIGGVDPTDPDRVYLRSNAYDAGGVSRLYVTTDGGATFRTAREFATDAGHGPSGELLGFALSPDGSKVFVGTRQGGLWSASRSDLAFTQVNATVAVQCLATRQTANGPELWACGNESAGPPGNPGNFIVGRSIDDGVTFEAKMQTTTTMKGIAQCPVPPAGATACGVKSTVTCGCDDYVSFCSSVEAINACLGCGMDGDDAGTDAGDAGPSDAGLEDAGKTNRPAGVSSCGCSAVGTGSEGGAALVVGFAATASCLRRRRRDRCRGAARYPSRPPSRRPS